MRCPRCQHDNRAQAKFCEQCATPLARQCAQCGSPLSESAKFCPECAHPAAAAPSSERAERPLQPAQHPIAAEGERRQATVLVADISGYTALCARLDAEQVQALLGRFYDLTDGIVAAYGGHIIDHAGDATLAVFGAPVAHGNDNERAARAALDMHAQAHVLTDPSGAPLTLHIGIAGGEVVAATIAAGAQPKYAITGEAVNLAARLNALAQSGQTIVAEAVWRALAQAFDGAALGEVNVKGFAEPARIWKLDGVRRARADRRAFIGRQVELRQLLGVLDAVEETRSGLTVYVRGEAGIGKSRLIDELRARAQARGFACHTGWVLDFGLGKGQDALPAIVKDLLDAGPASDPGALESAVTQALARGWIEPAQQALINDLLELAQPPHLRAAFDAMDAATRSQRLGEMLVGLIQRTALERPRLLVVEDIHWAAPALLRYLALIARAAATARIVLVMTSRFEGDPLDQAWRASTHGSPLMTVDLGPLRPDEAKQLAAGLITADKLASECIERAEGNPLFLEQLLRNAAESQAAAVPASIQSLVLARMDRLSVRDKAALQAASVLGKRFNLQGVHALIDEAAYACDALVAADLVRPEGNDLIFAHALIQEGVYSSLLKTKKRELHQRAAQWFGEDEPILHAQHLDRAGDPNAADAYLRAAQEQSSKFRHESATRLTERGIEIATQPDTLCRLWLLRGDLLREVGHASESIAAFEKALTYASDDARRCQAWMGVAAAHRITSDIPAALAATDRAFEHAQHLDSPAQRSRIHHVRGNLLFAAGKAEECRVQHEAALRYAQDAGDVECEAQALSGLGDAQYLHVRILSGLEYFKRSLALCEQAGLVKLAIGNRCMIGHCGYYAGRFEDSIGHIRRALEDSRRIGYTYGEIFAQESLGMLFAESGHFEAAEQALLEGIPVARHAGARRYLTAQLYSLATLKLQEGKRDEARALLDEALSLVEQTGPSFYGPVVWSGIALCASSYGDARAALDRGEVLLRGPCVAHCYLHFYRDAIDVNLAAGQWDEVLRHAAALEDFVRHEPLHWAMLVIERGRLLAAIGAASPNAEQRERLRALRARLAHAQLLIALPEIDRALAA